MKEQDKTPEKQLGGDSQSTRKRMEAKIEKIPKCMEAKNMLLNNQRVTEKVKEKKKKKK